MVVYSHVLSLSQKASRFGRIVSKDVRQTNLLYYIDVKVNEYTAYFVLFDS